MRDTFGSRARLVLAFVSFCILLGPSPRALAQSPPLTVSLTTDRGCGASAIYQMGEPNQFLFSVNKIARVTLTLTLPDGTVRPVRTNMAVVNGVTYSIPGIIGNPPGQRLLTIDAASGTETAHAQCTYTAAGVVANPLTAALATNRGCGSGAVFNIGESDVFTYSVSKTARVTLTLHRPDGAVSVLVANQTVPGGAPQSLSGVIGNPPGQRLLTLDAVSGTETAHVECTYAAAGTVPNPLTVTLTTNKGCGAGAVYSIGEPDTFSYSASKNATVTLRLLRPDGTQSILAANQPVGGGVTQTFSGMIGNPAGQRTLILDAVAGTERAHAECTYSAVAGGGGGGGPITLGLSINHGCGGQYRPGDSFVVTYSASTNTNLTLTYRRFDGTQFDIFTNRPVIGGQVNTYSAVIGNGSGGRTLILQTSPPMAGGQATCAFTIVP
jgi:hypothetical protein